MSFENFSNSKQSRLNINDDDIFQQLRLDDQGVWVTKQKVPRVVKAPTNARGARHNTDFGRHWVSKND